LADNYVVKHFGGLTMQQKRGVRTIFLLLGFILAVSGCAIGKDQTAFVYFGLSVEAIPEGIVLIFDNIPPETDCLEISITDENSKVYLEISHSRSYFAKTEIRGNSLELVKKTGKVFFPFVHAGHEYEISTGITYSIPSVSGSGRERGWGSVRRNTLFIAENGYYYDKYLELTVNESQTSVTLPSEPVFPVGVQYNSYDYRYGVVITAKHDDGGGTTMFLPNVRSVDGRRWELVPELNNQLKSSSLQSGDYPIFVTAYCSIVYDNIAWEVDIAKSPAFIFSYK
jgi:hypothetical protein